MIIIISNPETVKDEYKIIHQLFDEGLEIFHIRKKEFSEIEMRKFIKNIHKDNFKKLVLHSHYLLVEEYGLKGVHIPITYSGKVKGKTTSISFHSIDEIQKCIREFDYGFLSPVFDSISKVNYKSKFNLSEIDQFLKHSKKKIIALGGIDEDKIETVKNMGFSGIAFLGAIWQSEHPVENYKRIKDKWLN